MPVRLVWSCTITATSPSPPISSAILSAASAGSRNVVGGGRRNRNVAVHARVKTDDRNTLGLGLFQQRHHGLGVERSQADGGRVLGQGSLQHLDLLVDLRLGLGAFKGDVDVEVRSSLLGTELHSLPELVLEALGDDRDVRLGAAVSRSGSCSLGSSIGGRRCFGSRGFACGRGSRGSSRRGTTANQRSYQHNAQHDSQQVLVFHVDLLLLR